MELHSGSATALLSRTLVYVPPATRVSKVKGLPVWPKSSNPHTSKASRKPSSCDWLREPIASYSEWCSTSLKSPIASHGVTSETAIDLAPTLELHRIRMIASMAPTQNHKSLCQCGISTNP